MLILLIIFSTLSVVTFSKTNLFVQSFCFFISIKLGWSEDQSIFSYILSYNGEKIIKVIGYFLLIIYKLFCSPLDPFFEKNGLIVFQKSPDFVPPEQRSKKYLFIDFLFNLVTKFLCFLNFSQYLLL